MIEKLLDTVDWQKKKSISTVYYLWKTSHKCISLSFIEGTEY